MNADKAELGKFAVNTGNGLPQEPALLPRMECHIIPVRLDPIHVSHFENGNSIARRYRNQIGSRVRIARCSLTSDARQCLRNLSDVLTIGSLSEGIANSRQSFIEAGVIDWLENIVQRLHLKRAYCVLIECSYK